MEARLFPEGTVPEWTIPEWYAARDRAGHLEEGPHIGRLHMAAGFVRTAISMGATSVVDLGAGDGGLLSLIAPLGVPAWGYDLQPTNVDGSKERGVDVRYANVLEDIIEWGDCAVATECLEHLIDPHGFVREVAAHSRWLVASCPAFETPGNAYAFHCWAFDFDGMESLVTQAGFDVICHDITGDFQVLLAECP